MGTVAVRLLLVVSAAIAAGVVAYIIINRGKRQQAQISAGKLQREVEEAQQKIEEDRQRHAAEEARQKAQEKNIPPEKRGGRPSGQPQDQEKPATQETKPRCPKPEIVCWQRERRWILAVEVPEDLWEHPELMVYQNASPLAQDEREGYWRLDQVCGQITVHWNEDEAPQEAMVVLSEENHLLFKLSGQDQKRGRRVKSPSSGSYLVVVPESWERDEEFSGSPSASPEPVSVEGYQGHFFDLEKGGDKRIVFRTSEGKSILIESKAAQFELVGTRLCDASEGIGPLFGKSPPRIRAFHGQTWTDIRTIVVGEEGSARRRWRKPFGPTPEGIEQDLPSEVAERRGGWYFLRFYDTNDELTESLDFRFICTLKEIRVPQPSPFPSEDGHKPVYIEFLHEPGCVIQPVDSVARRIQIGREHDRTILTIPPDPTCDETCWLVGPEDGPQVQVTTRVERLWWTVGEEQSASFEWQDRVLTLPRDDFIKRALWLRLPAQRWVAEVLVGFERPNARRCPAKVTEKTVCVPLRDFGYGEQVQRVGITPLNLWFYRQGTTYTWTPCALTVRMRCRTSGFMAFRQEDMSHHLESLQVEDFLQHAHRDRPRWQTRGLPSRRAL